MTFPLNLYSINSILPHLSLICQNTCFDRVYISSGFFFLFFYPLKLVIGFTNVISFKLKNHDSLFDFNNTFKFVYGDHSLSHMTHLLSFLLFITLNLGEEKIAREESEKELGGMSLDWIQSCSELEAMEIDFNDC